MDTKEFDLLNDDDKKVFLDGLKTYLGYETEIQMTRESQKDQISRVASKVENFSRKDVRKLFNYFKKNIKPNDLRSDAEVIERIAQDLHPGLMNDEE